MINLLEEKNIIFPLNIIKFKRTSSFGEIKTYAGPGNEGLHLLNWINTQINLGNINVTVVPADVQAKIQFEDEGINLGTSGTVTEVDFVGDGVTATRVLNKVTVTIPGVASGQTDIQFQDEGIDLGSAGDVDTIDFTGDSVTASIAGSVLTVNIEGTTLVEYNAGNGVRVLATDTGVSASWSTGVLTISIPSNVRVVSARLHMTDGSNVQSGADAGGATNWIRVIFDNTTGYNTSVTDMKVPSVQKCLYASGVPGLANAYSIDIDNNPNIAVVGVGSNSITLRIWNLIIPNGGQLTFNGI